MKIALIGGTGRTGRHVLTQALDRGDGVTALVRDAGRLPISHENLRVVEGSVLDEAAIADLLEDADVVISALGPTAKEPDLHTRAARLLVARMSEHGPRRFVGISGAGIDVPGDQKSGSAKTISWLIQHLGGAVVKDKPAEYEVWSTSGLDWTLARPPRLMDGEATDGPLEQHAHRSTASTKIMRPDLARFLLDTAHDGTYVGQAPFVATPRG